MADPLTIRQISDASGIGLPQSLLDALDLEEGDELYVVQDADGTLRLTPHDPEADALDDARAFMDSHEKAFQKLAV